MPHTEHKFSLLPGKLRKGHHHVGRITGIEVQRERVYYLSVFDKLRHGDKVVRKLHVLPPLLHHCRRRHCEAWCPETEDQQGGGRREAGADERMARPFGVIRRYTPSSSEVVGKTSDVEVEQMMREWQGAAANRLAKR